MKTATLGRPNKYSKELADKIIDRISTTSLGLASICAPDDMPCRATVYNWLSDEKNKIFLDRYARAKELQTELIAEEMLDICDDGSNDLMTIVKGDLEYEQENKEVTSRSKLRVETRKWLLAKLAPKKYGDKIEHSGELNVAVTGMKIV